MKKKIKLFLIFMFTINIGAQELSGRITYNVSLNLTVKEVTERYKKQKIKIPKWQIDRINNARDLLAFLEFNSTNSIQKLEKKLKNEGALGINKTRKGAGNEKIYFTNNSFIQKNSIVECKALGKCFLVEQPKPVWKITQESKIIGGYLCYRATYENKLYEAKKPVAWFAPELAFGYGPKFFTGLPGLILELEDNIVTYKAIKIELNPKEKIIVKKPEGEEITKEKYDILIRKAHPAFYKRLEKYRNSKKS